ncbi:MAG TPA: tetratricopeptide repeat protein [Coleofasciculaceae cyanobacterium]
MPSKRLKRQPQQTLFLPLAISLLSVLLCLQSQVKAESSLPNLLTQASETPNSEAGKLLAQGIEQLDNNKLNAALESFQQALTLQRQMGNRLGEAVILNNLGVTYYYQGQYEKAIASYRESMQLLWKVYDRAGIGATLNNQSIASLQLGDYRKAIEFCHGAIAIFRTLGDPTREAAALNNMGIAYEKLDDYGRAVGYFREALTTAQDNSDHPGEMVALKNLEDAYSKLGQLEKVKEVEQQVLLVQEEIRKQGNTIGSVSSNDYLLLRQHERSLAMIFSNTSL